MADRRLLAVAAAALSACLLLAGCGGGADEADLPGGPEIVTGDNAGYTGTYLGDDPFVITDVPLTDTAGDDFSVAAPGDRLEIVFFGYSMCPDICQIVMSTITQALTRVQDRDRVEVVFVTTDPARDTRPVLREYLDRFTVQDGEYVGLTGPLADIVRLGDSFKVDIAKGRKLPSGGYEVDHTTYAYGVTDEGAKIIWRSDISPKSLAADIDKLLGS